MTHEYRRAFGERRNYDGAIPGYCLFKLLP
jgi:hypothetical protein